MTNIACTINKLKGMIAYPRSWWNPLLSPRLQPAGRSPYWYYTPCLLIRSFLNFSCVKLNWTSSKSTRIIVVLLLTSRYQIKTIKSSLFSVETSLVVNTSYVLLFQKAKKYKFSFCTFLLSSFLLTLSSTRFFYHSLFEDIKRRDCKTSRRTFSTSQTSF